MSTCSGLMDFFPANFMLQPPNENDHQSISLHGIAPMLGKRSGPFQGVDHPFHEEANGGGGGGGSGEEDNLSDDGSQAIGEKKRRLNIEQVKTLEKNFELGNKLEPERKLLLAKALGLQPRQIAIWFQNRRARCKTKQLEKDYVILKRQFESLKADNESLLARNQKLQTEILTLKGREPIESINLNKETDQGSCSNRSETSSEIKLDISTRSTAMKTTIGGAIDSPLSDHPTSNRAFFPPHPPSSAINRPDGPSTRLFQGPPMARPDLHYQRFDHTVKEEGLNNMFCGIDDQSGYWPWIDQHHSFN